MNSMWCKNCNIETNGEKCRVCGRETYDDAQTKIYWCNHCRTPVIQGANMIDKETCPQYNKVMKYLATDIRPVFPNYKAAVSVIQKWKKEFPETY